MCLFVLRVIPGDAHGSFLAVCSGEISGSAWGTACCPRDSSQGQRDVKQVNPYLIASSSKYVHFDEKNDSLYRHRGAAHGLSTWTPSFETHSPT